jgi:hypothetical protein
VKERKQAKGISDTDDRKHHRKSESSDNSKKRELEPRKSVSDDKKVRVYEVKMYKPEIRGVHFTTSEDLRKYIDAELPGLKHLPYFKKIMHDAESHIELRAAVSDKQNLMFPEIRNLAEQMSIPLWTARKWINETGAPNLYRLSEKAITKSEARTILEQLREKRNGVDSISEINCRLNNSYFGEHIRQLKAHRKDLDMSRKYFKFLDFLSKGGINADIARRVGILPPTGQNYTNGIFPRIIKRAKDYPSEEPRKGWKWLPGRTGDTRQFIEVPLKATEWSEIQQVLDQIQPLSGPRIQRWQSMFGLIKKEEAFMYSLGSIIADGSLDSKSMSSKMTLALSKKYKWSPSFGEAVCYCLGVLGIHAEKGKDRDAPNNVITERGKKRRISGPGFHTWASKHYPLLRWMRKSCLGISDVENKTKFPIDCEWALTAPIALRKAFLQGIADGDGYVSVNSQYIGLSTRVNQPFYGRLLKSFNVESIPTTKDVLIKQCTSMLKVADLGLFRHAESRCEFLEELRTLVHARRAKPIGSRLTKEEIEYAVMLRGKNKSYGEITRNVFRTFGNSWDISTIEHAIKRHQEGQKV